VKVKTERISKAVKSTGSESHMPKMVNYEVGGDKVWWLKVSSQSFVKSYFKALLLAHEHNKPVEHLASVGYYNCLLEGREFITKEKRGGFNFCDEGGGVRNAKGKRKRTGALEASGKQRRAAKEKVKSLEVESEASEKGQSSSSSSTSSSSSSESKSTTSRKASIEPPIVPGVPVDTPSPNKALFAITHPSSLLSRPADEMSVVSALSGASGRTGGGVLLPTTFFFVNNWFRFTQVKDDNDVQVGWETVCYITEHQERNVECRKNLKFLKHGGKEALERKLKWWCLNAQMASNRIDHRDMRFPKEIPTLEEIHAHEYMIAGILGTRESSKPRSRYGKGFGGRAASSRDDPP
jgi:hypothetical protein